MSSSASNENTFPAGSPFNDGTSVDGHPAATLNLDPHLRDTFKPESMGRKGYQIRHPSTKAWGVNPSDETGLKWSPYGYTHPSLHCHHADIASHPTIIHSIGYLGEGDGRHIVLNSCWMCTVQGKEDCSLLHLPLDSREIQRRTRSNQSPVIDKQPPTQVTPPRQAQTTSLSRRFGSLDSDDNESNGLPQKKTKSDPAKDVGAKSESSSSSTLPIDTSKTSEAEWTDPEVTAIISTINAQMTKLATKANSTRSTFQKLGSLAKSEAAARKRATELQRNLDDALASNTETKDYFAATQQNRETATKERYENKLKILEESRDRFKRERDQFRVERDSARVERDDLHKANDRLKDESEQLRTTVQDVEEQRDARLNALYDLIFELNGQSWEVSKGQKPEELESQLRAALKSKIP